MIDNSELSVRYCADKWTSIEHLQKHHPSKIFLMDETEYLADIITTINNQHTGEKII